jgi:hypothetical protein
MRTVKRRVLPVHHEMPQKTRNTVSGNTIIHNVRFLQPLQLTMTASANHFLPDANTEHEAVEPPPTSQKF